MKKKYVVTGITILVGAIVCGIAMWKYSAAKSAPAAVNVPTVKVTRGSVIKSVFAQGVISDSSREELTPEVKARVTGILVQEGQTVKAGDLLFTMEDEDARLALEQAELECESRKRDLEEASLAAASDLVTAQASGRVTQLLVKEGDRVEKNTPVAKITDPGFLEVTAPFGPMGIEKISNGLKATVCLSEFMSYLEGIVVDVDRAGRAASGGGKIYDVTVRFRNPGAVAAGSQASVAVALAGGGAVNSFSSAEVEEPDVGIARAAAPGAVLQLEVREGQNIVKNDVIARIDTSESRAEIGRCRLALRQAELAWEIKQNEIEKYRVYAGQEGIVTELNISSGQEPLQDRPAIVISAARGMELKATVEEVDMPVLRLGQEAAVYAGAFGNRSFPGQVVYIASQGEAEGSSVVFETKIQIEAPGPLKVGMTGDADVIIAKKEGVLRLPVSAVIFEGRKSVVMIPGPEEAKTRTVDIGLKGDEYIEIVGGITEGEEVLENPAFRTGK
ncbi:efflux RND transporter periplasmic adaptor subunit [Phosphitispora fastidiosa]|uniref:efflux RND transporter periplasmic adaptor subunit n=1 Tax=Phosphitispora fastidiosa TaxID=2837202 RepID=UPI001E626E80|nr:biotin/lipoyl-binding protein [Phosphitispora fastidiosa]MBU7006491.1 HlyD family secretion protein [Phosphitispora fastidiosa]